MSMNNPGTHFITLLRHGKSQANEDNILQGQMDSPLSEEGIQQSNALADHWIASGTTFHEIISSPLGRAYETARIVSNRLSIPIVVDEKWMEREFGEAEGLPYEEIFSRFNTFPPRSIYKPAYETGESDWDLYIRAAKAIQQLILRPSGKYLVVSHGAIMNAALASILGITPRPTNQRIRFTFNNTGYAQLEFNEGTQNWYIRSLNNVNHLASTMQENDM